MNEELKTNALTMDRSPGTVALDNLIRRKLRVSDPQNPMEIAAALKKLYLEESQALQREAEGVPFFRAVSVGPAKQEAEVATRAELKQAVDDVERDLHALTTSSLVKDVHAELRGWANAIRSAISEGTQAARFALDPRQRDRAFAARRLLGSYARLARYVGALTPNLNVYYRRLAQSLDEVAGVILVLLGDALANIGYSGGRFLLQAPASELQSRRDAVIYALRNLTGSMQEGYGPNDWPRGLVAYRQFLNRLEDSGQTDLRALFVENNVARAMDELIHWTTSGSADDLRALGSTAHMALEKFQRLILLGQRLVDPESPPLSAFLSAVQLFVDAFLNAASGHRLLYISRPPIVFYGLYGFGDLDAATKRLLALIQARGNLANLLDCYLGCDCSREKARCQILLDKILFDVDRAIDLYALGTDPQGEEEPEVRAAAYGVLIDVFLHPIGTGDELPSCITFQDGPLDACGNNRLQAILIATRDLLWWADPTDLAASEGRKFDLADFRIQINGQCLPTTNSIGGFTGTTFRDLKAELQDVLAATLSEANGEITDPLQVPTFSDASCATRSDVQSRLQEYVAIVNVMHQELCIQQSIESEWENLLETMAPSCIRFKAKNGQPCSETILATEQLISDAIEAVALSGQTCPRFAVNIPPHHETSLDSIANDITRRGDGRGGI